MLNSITFTYSDVETALDMFDIALKLQEDREIQSFSYDLKASKTITFNSMKEALIFDIEVKLSVVNPHAK